MIHSRLETFLNSFSLKSVRESSSIYAEFNDAVSRSGKERRVGWGKDRSARGREGR